MTGTMPAGRNRRILVIDDNRAIHDDFRKILSPTIATAAALDATEAALFGQAPDAVAQTTKIFTRGMAMELAFARAGGLLIAGCDPSGIGNVIPALT